MKSKILLITILIFAAYATDAQNVGIGTATPGTKLTVAGGIASTPATATAAAAVTIPNNASVFYLTAAAGTRTDALTMAVPTPGQYLTIYNMDANPATFAGYTITASTGVLTFQYINGSWEAVSDNSYIGVGTYIKNQTAQQSSSNFNISGNGVIGGTASVQSLSAAGIVTNTSAGLLGTTAIVPVAYGGTGSSTQNWVDLSTTQTAAGAKTWSNNATFNGGTTSLGNGTSNMIAFNGAGVAAPTFTTSSAGTKIIFYPQVSGTTVDYAMGIASGTLWHSVPGTTSGYVHSWYGGTTELMRIQGNGLVGIGTTAPYATLDVHGNIVSSAHGATSEHSTAEQGTFYIGHQAGNGGLPTGGDGFAGIGIEVGPGANGLANAGVIQFYTWGNSVADAREVARINESGYFGVGTTAPAFPIDVETSVSYTVANPSYAYGQSGHGPNENVSGASESISIKAVQNVMGVSFIGFSDARIKDVIGRSNPQDDLATLRRIRITDYTMRDVAAYGHKPAKKVIAQELRQVYPIAVKTTAAPMLVPDIYQSAVAYKIDGMNIALQMPEAITDTNVRAGSVCVFYTSDTCGRETKYSGIITDIASSQISVRIAEPLSRGALSDRLFVYGTEVNDFLAVDYEAVAMLNVSATQELARKLDEQEKKNKLLEQQVSQLRDQNATLQTQNASTRSDVDRLKASVETLQQIIGSKAEK